MESVGQGLGANSCKTSQQPSILVNRIFSSTSVLSRNEEPSELS
jgi:hypothetical protein